MTAPNVQSGLDRLAALEPEIVGHLAGRRVGLLAHPASVDAQLRHATSLLPATGARLCALFGPEHGYSGQAQDMKSVAGDQAQATPVYSLYGATFEELSPRPEWLAGLDAVLIDLQDVGSRYYTFVWSAALMLIACARAGVECIVLDRPNPLGGSVLEGASQRPGYRSFVGLYDVPVRHGMTIAELLTMVRELEGLDAAALRVVAMRGYQRAMLFGDTGLPWVLPSPNMPTLDTALVYPGGCLIEGTNLSEGRGSTRPFEIWGAPFVDGVGLARELSIEGACLRPLSFEPTFHKHAKTTCGGVQVHVTQAGSFRSYAAYLRMIAWVAQRAEQFRFRVEPYEYVSDRPAIDLLTGGPEYREALNARAPIDELIAWLSQASGDFEECRRGWLLY
jgi:uncharacterized protein YbbC (DUF1343 family)